MKHANVHPIVTLTLNPAVDLTTGVPRVEPDRKLRCEPALREPGGGGINASRVIAVLGGTSTAVFTAGGPLGERLQEMVRGRGIATRPVPIAQSTRESFTVDERSTGAQYRFLLPGPELAEAEWRECLAAVEERMEPDAVVLVSGSVPPGVPEEIVAMLAAAARAAGARLVVDVSGPPAAAALAEGVHVARFNTTELEELVGRPLPDPEERHREAARMVERGGADVVVATVGQDGALVATREERFHLRPPVVVAASAVGAGDSLMGALSLGLAHGWDLRTAAALGVAAAAAAHMTPGTGLCRRPDVVRLYSEMCGAPPPQPEPV